MNPIGGALDYAKLAQLHRPTDPAALASQVRELASRGLTERDIGQHLRLDPSAVRSLLASRGDEAAEMHARAWK
jgi:hypothetical protein